MLCDTDCVSSARTQLKQEEFLPLIANVLFVPINVSLEKISVKFPPFVNLSCCVIFDLNKFACVC